MGRRIRWVGLALVLCFAAVLAQLVNVQVREATALNATAHNPRQFNKQYDNQRGLILAADGTVLAKSVPVPGAKTGTYQYYRQYPLGTLFAGIVGFSDQYYGTTGVENHYNAQLRLHTQKTSSISQLLNPPPPTTYDLTLTVTPKLQKVAQQSVAAIADANKDAAVVALDPRTGGVLVDYSNPTYDPNALATPTVPKEQAAEKADSTKDAEGFYPGVPMATADTFLPGSTFKVVTSAAVYNLKPTLATFNFPTAGCTTKGAIPQTTKQICNDANTPTAANPCGGTMIQMLPESCDPGYAMLGLALGGTTLYKQSGLFGFNTAPPIDLTSSYVSKSNFPTPTQLAPTGKLGPPGVALSAFGQQTVTATALQNAMVAEGIANTGVVMTPHVMAEIRNQQGQVVQTYEPSAYKSATTTAAARQVNSLMQSVVNTPHGTAYGVGFTPRDRVAVKTGTAQTGNSAQNTIDWMIGFAPANNPVVAVAVVVPEQAVSTSGAEVAGPIMKAMITAALAQEPAGTKTNGLAPPPTNPPTTIPPSTVPVPVTSLPKKTAAAGGANTATAAARRTGVPRLTPAARRSLRPPGFGARRSTTTGFRAPRNRRRGTTIGEAPRPRL